MEEPSRPGEAPRDDYFARVCRAVEYADEHLDEVLSLARLAEVACFSPRHFHRIFSSLLDESPDDCVRRLRLEKAASLILLPKPPSMTEVAFACGFGSSALLSRNFSRRFGSSPTEWRDGMKRQAKVAYRQAPVTSGKDHRSTFRYFVGEDDEEVEIDAATTDPQFACCVLYLGYDEGVSRAYARLIRWARPRGLLAEGSRVVAIPLDNPAVTPPRRCRNYAGIIPGPTGTRYDGGSGGLVRVVEIKGGSYLRARFRGTNRGLHNVYRLLYEVVAPELGYATSGGRSLIEYPGNQAFFGFPGTSFPGAMASADAEVLVNIPVRPA